MSARHYGVTEDWRPVGAASARRHVFCTFCIGQQELPDAGQRDARLLVLADDVAGRNDRRLEAEGQQLQRDQVADRDLASADLKAADANDREIGETRGDQRAQPDLLADNEHRGYCAEEGTRESLPAAVRESCFGTHE